MTTYMNTSERYGDQEIVTIQDYQELNPTGQFVQTDNGIYEIMTEEQARDAHEPTTRVRVAVAVHGR